MQLTLLALTSALVAFTSADQVINIHGLTVRNTDSVIQSTSFVIEPENDPYHINCAEDMPFSQKVVTCSDKDWSFYLTEYQGVSSYNLSVYEATGPGVGLYHIETVNLDCSAGPGGSEDYVCNQEGPIQFDLTFSGN